MKISSIVGKDKLTLSFEVFPPKTDSDFEKVKEAALLCLPFPVSLH